MIEERRSRLVAPSVRDLSFTEIIQGHCNRPGSRLNFIRKLFNYPSNLRNYWLCTDQDAGLKKVEVDCHCPHYRGTCTYLFQDNGIRGRPSVYFVWTLVDYPFILRYYWLCSKQNQRLKNVAFGWQRPRYPAPLT